MYQPFTLGSVVYSRAGRDKGRFFLVVEVVDENFVRIADGKTRMIAKAKLKKIKHLKNEGVVIQKIADKLANNRKVFDVELFSALKVYN
ncbi:MAG: RNA-binding protein [Christensenellales bacterium]|jgi:large subunit ribosomal protein L14e